MQRRRGIRGICEAQDGPGVRSGAAPGISVADAATRLSELADRLDRGCAPAAVAMRAAKRAARAVTILRDNVRRSSYSITHSLGSIVHSVGPIGMRLAEAFDTAYTCWIRLSIEFLFV